MRKYVWIAIVSVACIACLQAYIVYLQYRNHVERQRIAVTKELRIALSEELLRRELGAASMKYDKNRSIEYKVLSKDEVEATAKRNGLTVYDFSTVDMPHFVRIGIVDKETDLQELAGQDQLSKKGKAIRLNVLDSIFTNIHGFSTPHTLFLLDSQKHIIKRYGATDVRISNVYSNDVPIGLSPLRYVRIKIHIPLSYFFQASIDSILLSILFTVIIFVCIGCQLSAIRRIRNVVKRLQSPLSSILLLLSAINESVEDPEVRTMIVEAEEMTDDLARSIKVYLKESKDKPGKSHEREMKV